MYFVCTRLLRNNGKGITLVVSPLMVLMSNQKEAAGKLGIRCDILNSSTQDKHDEILDRMKKSGTDLVPVTPETLFKDDVQNALRKTDIGLFVIDEAHCISDWGHDFRPEYTRLNRVIKKMPDTWNYCNSK
ncbi:MAG: DEAD/DEAH box helicase [Firmicutes bacterium]|nr:DEAD/DEAH box helicase [Bacillota bacterium]